jgi:hypothetical protein
MISKLRALAKRLHSIGLHKERDTILSMANAMTEKEPSLPIDRTIQDSFIKLKELLEIKSELTKQREKVAKQLTDVEYKIPPVLEQLNTAISVSRTPYASHMRNQKIELLKRHPILQMRTRANKDS